MSTHILICFAAFVTNCIFVRLCLKELHFHFNCRILILTLVSLNVLHSIIYALMLTIHFIKLMIVHENPCDVMMDGSFCFSLRLATSACYIGHTTVLFGLLLERFLATRFVATYELSSSKAGYFISCCSVSKECCSVLNLLKYTLFKQLFSAVLLSYYKMRLFRMDQRSVYCSSVTTETYTDVFITHCLLLVLLIVTIVIFGFIFFQNRRVRSRITRNVSEKYQAIENLRALRILAPLLIFHFICYPFYFAISITTQSLKHITGDLYFRVVYSAVYCPSYYCVLSPLILLYIIKRRKATRKKTTLTPGNPKPQREDDVYFQNYRSMW
ncbi:hypothetical protein Y032_0395g646 [Ancylostoma ceylanicum]|nr:hypothetical protein Y032_0395g646 [Ancylostoma ceylanicum]